MEQNTKLKLTVQSIVDWMKSDVTVTAPGWAFAAAGAVALILFGIALD